MKVKPIATNTPLKPFGKNGVKCLKDCVGSPKIWLKPKKIKTDSIAILESVKTFSVFPVTSAPRIFNQMKNDAIIAVTTSTTECCLNTECIDSARPGKYFKKNSQKYPPKPSA